MNSTHSYLHDLATACSAGWNRFWFTARDARTLSLLRILTGCCAFYYVASFTPDLVRWFGPDGILDAATTGQLVNREQGVTSFRLSYLYLAQSPAALWACHVAGLAVLVAYTAGLFSRVMNLAAVVVTLSYIHRGPLLDGRFELVLAMLLVYLCIGRTGTYWSVDSWWARRRQMEPTADRGISISNTIATRLIQLHLAGLSITIGLNMLAGEVWWSGEAIWWLIARSESRLVDLTGLSSFVVIINFWTHSVAAYLLGFGVLIWNRLTRPLFLGAGLIIWISLALVTGEVAWCLTMLVASLAFVGPEQLARMAQPQPT